MGNQTNQKHTQTDGVAVTYQHIYSAKDLAEIMKTRPMMMMELDMGLQTKWYDVAYIEEIARQIENEADIEMLLTWIVQTWRRQTDERHERVSYFSPEFKQWVPYVEELDAKLDGVLTRIRHSREIIRQEEEFRRIWAKRYSSQTALPNFGKSLATPSTPQPTDFVALYPYEKQSEDVRKKLNIQGELYSEMADIIAVEVKDWMKGRSIKDWNVLRYVLRKHNVFPDNVSHRIFADFLNTILRLEGDDALKPDTISSRSDANVMVGQQISWQLKKDSEALEKMLKPIFDKM